jgi:hypothetical protein
MAVPIFPIAGTQSGILINSKKSLKKVKKRMNPAINRKYRGTRDERRETFNIFVCRLSSFVVLVL